MSKGERLQQEARAKKNGKVSGERAEQKSSKYDGGFIDLVDEGVSKNKEEMKKIDKTTKKDKEPINKENSTELTSKKKTSSKEVETEKLSKRRPSEEGFFSDSKNIQTINIRSEAKENGESKVKSAVNQAKEKIKEEKANKTKATTKENDEKIKEENVNSKKPNQEKPKADKHEEKKSNKENLNIDKINKDKPVHEKPVNEKPVSKKPVNEKPVSKKPVHEKPVNKKPVNEKPVHEKQIKKEQNKKNNSPKEEKQIEGLFSQSPDNERATKDKKSVAKKSINKMPIDKKAVAKEPILKEPIVKKAIDEKPAVKDPIVKKVIDKKPVVKDPIVKKAIDKKPVVDDPIVKEPVGKQPIVKEPIAKKSIEKKPAVKNPIVDKPIPKKQPGNKPVAKKPAPPKKEPRKPMSKGAKMLLRMGIPAALLLCVYIAGSIFYSSQFIDRTFINGYDFSRIEPAVVSRFFEDKGDNFAIRISGIGGLEETITGEELELSISDNGQVAALFESQSSWRWPIFLVTGADYEINLLIDYNEALLEDRVAEIVCVDRDITIEPVDAKPVFNGERFEIQEEVLGTLIDSNIMMSHIQASMSAYGNFLDLYEIGAYIRPAIFSSNPNLIAAVDRLNHYVGASITYDLNPKQVVVNHEQIVDWLSWDGGFNVTFHEEMARGFMDDFIEMYSTRGSTRSFTNPLGKTAEVDSDFFGWLLDGETEVEAFLSNIRNGETAHREPAYFTRGSFHENGEWGDTYVQVCKTTQHLWYFVNGEFVLESPIVTGMAGSTQTPTGIFEILWMASPTVLRGPIIDHETGAREWESPVSYWMAITWCGIGLHDATWQPYFGGSRWTYGGSRGCINMPLGLAGELYRLVGEGTMVIVHW